MERLTELTRLINHGGSLGWAVVVVGGFGALFSLFVLFGALLNARSGVVRAFGLLCLVASLGTAATGAVATLLGRAAAERAAEGKRPSVAERLLRQGHLEARAGVTLGVPLGAAPILFGLLGLVVASRRRWTEYHETPPSGLGLAVLLLLLDAAAVAAGVWLQRQPIPGRVLDEDGWRVRELVDALDAGEWELCLTTPWQLPENGEARAMGAHYDNQQRCIEHYAAEGKLDRLEALAAAKWLDEPKLKVQLDEKVKALNAAPKVEAPEPAPPPPPATYSADIAAVQAKAKACFDKAVKKKKRLTLSTALGLEIAPSGVVVAVRDVGPGRPDAARKCAVSAAKGLKLRAGEARKLEVPLSFP